MERKNPLLTWLFGSDREKEPQASEAAPQQSAPQEQQSAPAEDVQDPFRLSLPVNHAVNKLASLSGSKSKPCFRFAGPDGKTDLLTAKVARQELTRLLLSVNSSANQRLSKAVPKGKKKTGEEPPPPPNLDAQVVVFVTGDGMSAWVFAYPPVGTGQELNREMLSNALQSKQVCFGLDEGLLDALPGNPERYFHLFPVARGRPAVPGKDGRIVDLFSRKPERRLVVDEFNRVDYASLSFVQNVEEGDVICRIIPPVKGEAGRTVLDREISVRDGQAATVPKGRNTAVSEDGSSLVASKTGHVEFSGRTFQVKPVLEIEGNVDFSTGHINFLGDVHIHGDICAGFTVRAMGSITVDGVVEAGTVEAGTDLIIVKGAQGDNRAVLRANRGIFAKYLESCCVYSMESLQTDCLINCDVYCDGTVEVRSGRGTIIGGSVRCAHEVDASVVGSRAECRTDIILGGMPCQEFDREVLELEIAELEEELGKVECQPESPTRFTRMNKLRMQLSLNRNKLEQFLPDLEHTEESEAAGEPPGIRRLVCGTAYPGTTVTIGPGSYTFTRETRPVNATLSSSGEILII